MTRMRGDLILYTSSGRWYERLITLATRGPFVHVALVVDAQTVIAARTQGISYEAMPPEDDQHATVPIAACSLAISGTDQHGEPVTETTRLSGRATLAGIEQGMAWATAQQGRHYGWSDVIYQGIKFLWPRNPFQFGVEGHYDCSDFATRYLLQAGVVLPPAFDDPYSICPNDLARWAGLIGQSPYPTVDTPLQTDSETGKTP